MKNLSLTPEKCRRLQAAASRDGVFRILAVDHRRVLVKLMDRDGSGDVPAERVTAFKLAVVRTIGPLATAAILDPQYSVKQAVSCSAVPQNVGLLAAVDATAFAAGEPQPGSDVWDVRSARQIGAVGVKLYLPYHPEAGSFTAEQEDLVQNVVAQCAQEDMPLFLEPVLRSADSNLSAKSPGFAKERRRAAIRMVERLGALGPEVLKVEFPVDCDCERDESVWHAACAELNDASPVPWALLSAGEGISKFKTQLQIACEEGCSGFIAGRALWNEAATARDSDCQRILEEVVVARMDVLNEIANRYAQSWESHLSRR